MEAQRYPQDCDGIAGAAPAIDMTNTVMQALCGAVQIQAVSNPIDCLQVVERNGSSGWIGVESAGSRFG